MLSIGNKLRSKIKKQKLPIHIAIIMDGNGRWARKRGMIRTKGHKAGSEVLRKIVEESVNIGIKYLTVYGFSTENWNRSELEVSFLMDLLVEYFTNEINNFTKNNIKVNLIGKRSRLPDKVIHAAENAEKVTGNNSGLVLNIAVNYGGRLEIVDAIKEIAFEIAKKRLSINDIDEECVSKHLYTRNQPDPDLLIRPSGDLRLSNFLLWQSAYTELYLSKLLWPEFSRNEFLRSIISYQKRERRFGTVLST